MAGPSQIRWFCAGELAISLLSALYRLSGSGSSSWCSLEGDLAQHEACHELQAG